MEPNKLPPERVDELTQRLQMSLQRRRPRSWLIVGAALLVSVAGLGALAWYLYEGPEPPRLEVVAFDGLFRHDEAPRARAALSVPDDVTDYSPSALRGRDVLFLHGPLGAGAEPTKAATDPSGQAAVAWPVQEKETVRPFQARHIDAARRQGSDDQAAVHLVAPDQRLLLVDIEETLANVAPERWPELHPAAIETRPQAGEVLQMAKKDYRVAYLSFHPTRPTGYRKARGWVASQPALPPGPVLGREAYPGPASVDQARLDVLRNLQARFPGKLTLIVGSSESAAAAKALGLHAIQLGPGPAPAGVAHATDWGEIATHLK